MCFLPNSRASIGQAPGPIIANDAARLANMIGIEVLALRERTTQTSIKLISVPTTRVRRATKLNTDKPAPISSGTAADADAFLSWMTAQQTVTAALARVELE